jgi:transcription-repair coupling factor (superfamily II helicase)
MSLIDPIRLPATGTVTVDGVADGYEAFALAALAAGQGERPVIFVARDGQRLPAIAETLAFAAPGLPVLELPAWDCLPYDRVSPGADAAARRLDAFVAMAALRDKPHRAVILASANAVLQRMPPAETVLAQTIAARPGNQIDMKALALRLDTAGFERVSTVRDVGEYAVRGGILDLYAPGGEPLRLDSARPRATTRSMRRSARDGASPAWSTGCRCSTSGWKRCSTICPTRESSSTIWRARRFPSATR